MKRLILMRHAKSSWADPGQRDHDRPLNGRGQRASAAVGTWLKTQGYLPGLALVLSARRCQETWEGVVGAIGPAPTSVLPELYHAEADDILTALRAVAGAETVLILGHQPGVGEFAARLVATPPEDPDFDRYPTAATTVIEFETSDWAAIDWAGGRARDFMTPRGLE